MAERIGKCTNFGNCTVADKKEVITVPDGEEFVCPDPECRRDLLEIPKPSPFPKNLLIVAAVVLVAVLGVIAFFLWGGTVPPEPLPSTTTVARETTTQAVTTTTTSSTTTTTTMTATTTTEAREPEFTHEQVLDKLGQGEFTEVKALLRQVPSGSPEFQVIFQEMAMSAKVAVGFQYQKKGHSPSPMYPIDSPRISKLILTHQDNYRLELTMPRASENLWLYVFQKDHYGKIYRLFPDPVYSGGDNPVRGGQAYLLPPKNYLYLDELSSSETGPITETLYIIASPWKARDAEVLFGKIHEETGHEAREQLIRDFLERLRKRNDSGLASVFYQEFSFGHGR